MTRLTAFLSALLALAPRPAAASALAELAALAGPLSRQAAPAAPRPVPAAAAPSRRNCPADWEKRRIGNCWTTASFGRGLERSYVHPGGWVLDARCLADKRFSASDMLGALDAAARRIDPAVTAEAGGCLGTFNPDWARALKDEVWTRRIRVSCSQYINPKDDVCGDAGTLDVYMADAAGTPRPEQFRLITLRNVGACLGAESSGLAGVMLHETLHATDADSVPYAEHNTAWRRGQLDFIRDRVYATEALCAFGTDPATRKNVNFIQCKTAVGYRSESPRYELCRGFGMSFTHMPMGAVKH